MANYRGLSPRIRWGSGYVNALDVSDFDDAVEYPEPGEGSDFDVAPSGVEDSWIVRDDSFLEGLARWIPRDDTLTPKRASGWNGSTGWRAFLRWAWQKNVLKFHPDGRNLVVSPKMNADADASGIVDDWTYAAATATGATSLDGAESAQKLQITGGVTGAGQYIEVQQIVRGIMPGEVLSYSIEYKVSALVNCQGATYLQFLDSGGSSLSTSNNTGLVSATYARTSVTATAPANTAAVRLFARLLSTNAAATGVVWYRNAMLERKSAASSTFIDNPSVDAYLVAPMNGRPGLEPSKQRQVALKLRAAVANAVFDGY